jgi:hypothetical protein
MKTLLKLYSAASVVVIAFFVFFMVPWGILPFSDAVDLIIVGGIFAGFAGLYTLYFYRREGLELGWFLIFRGGFWIITAACLGTVMLVCGSLLFLWPDSFTSPIERGALPFGIVLVSLFWLALIFLLAYPAFGMAAKAAAYARAFRFWESVTYALIATVCAAMATLFFSLFLEVLNDILIRISVPSQWKAIWVFSGLLISAGVAYGLWKRSESGIEIDKGLEGEKK